MAIPPHPPISTSTPPPPFQVYTPFLAKNIAPPQVSQFLEGPTPLLKRGEGGWFQLWTYLLILWLLLMELHFALENTSDSCLFFQQALLCLLPYFFFLFWSPFLCLCTVFETISSNTDEVFSSINPYANVFLFGGLNVNHND